MEILAIALVTVVVGAVALRLSAFLLGLVAWFMFGAVVLSLLAGEPVIGGGLALATGAWIASQVATRVRRGEWRSLLLRGVARAAGAYRAAA